MGFPNAYYLKVHYLPVESEPLISEIESFFAALADKTRLQITLFLLSKEGATVQEISESLGKSQSLISHHLACLRNCGVVRVEKRGKFSYYSVTGEQVAQILRRAVEHVRSYSSSILSCEVVKEERVEERKQVLNKSL